MRKIIRYTATGEERAKMKRRINLPRAVSDETYAHAEMNELLSSASSFYNPVLLKFGQIWSCFASFHWCHRPQTCFSELLNRTQHRTLAPASPPPAGHTHRLTVERGLDCNGPWPQAIGLLVSHLHPPPTKKWLFKQAFFYLAGAGSIETHWLQGREREIMTKIGSVHLLIN